MPGGHRGPAFEHLHFLARSDNRVAVLTALSTGPSPTCSELQRETGIPRSTVSRILGELEDRTLVLRAGHRYEMTPFGGFLAERLHSIFDSIEAMQRLLQLLNQLSAADPDVIFTDYRSSEILTPTSADPRAPTRRFADRLYAASKVRLLVPDPVPVLVNEDSAIVGWKQTFDIVMPDSALRGYREEGAGIRRLIGKSPPGWVRIFLSQDDIDCFAGTLDETAVVGITDTKGGLLGYVETTEEAMHAWAAALVHGYQTDARQVDPTDLILLEVPARCS